MMALAAAVACAPGCAATPRHAIPIAVVVDGDRAAVGALPRVGGLELHEVALPEPPAQPADTAAPALVRARGAYQSGDLDACRRELAAVDVAAALARGDRDTAATALALDAGCAWANRAPADARADAARLASLGLALPAGLVPPDVEAVIGDAITGAGSAARVPLAIAGAAGARASVDGNPPACAVPCTLALAPGEHVVAVDTDGFVPAAQTVRLPDIAAVQLAQQPAPAALAAQQWRARVARGQPAADATGATLLARFASAPRVVYLHGDARVAGELVVDGKLVASIDRERGDTADAVRELAYDGGVLHRPAVWQRPWFWIAVAGVAVVAAGTIVAVTYTPSIRTSVGL
jgi:hypothetical protein|nr:PEGA domain-containing protein [Kofleriaceae bacterium]